jgi:hypothetical protein
MAGSYITQPGRCDRGWLANAKAALLQLRLPDTGAKSFNLSVFAHDRLHLVVSFGDARCWVALLRDSAPTYFSR